MVASWHPPGSSRGICGSQLPESVTVLGLTATLEWAAADNPMMTVTIRNNSDQALDLDASILVVAVDDDRRVISNPGPRRAALFSRGLLEPGAVRRRTTPAIFLDCSSPPRPPTSQGEYRRLAKAAATLYAILRVDGIPYSSDPITADLVALRKDEF